jgi:SAM-dependent methyltransferase
MQLSDDELKALYSLNYFAGEEYLDYEMEKPALQNNFRRRLKHLRRLHPDGGHLMEIGCAYGYFLEVAKEHFEVSGCDIAVEATAAAREKLGLDVVTGDFLAMDPPERPHDLVCLWDTVEHLRDPELYLAKAARELRTGGTLVLSTGDIGALLPRIQGESWRLIHPPTHLHYFSAKSITRLLSGLGFSRVEVKYDAFWRSADAVAFRLLATPQTRATAGLYRLAKKLGLLGFYFPVNTGDLMTVIAHK